MGWTSPTRENTLEQNTPILVWGVFISYYSDITRFKVEYLNIIHKVQIHKSLIWDIGGKCGSTSFWSIQRKNGFRRRTVWFVKLPNWVVLYDIVVKCFIVMSCIDAEERKVVSNHWLHLYVWQHCIVVYEDCFQKYKMYNIYIWWVM